GAFRFLHSLDRLALAEDLQRRCEGRPGRFPVFLQVNVSGEATKGGFMPEDVPRALPLISRDFHRLAPVGLMTMAPAGPPESARPVFRRLREVADVCMVQWLSMGMSGDFEVAIEEGATHIRLGSVLFK
ncbi:MAG TPA: alanine racemase, partial [Planctomycetota bacterium]|nr:alanine racemase [Planctomycetota bacterium]